MFDLEILSTSTDLPNPFYKVSSVTADMGTVYKIAPKSSGDPSLIRTVFIPNGTGYCQSDFYVHTAFLIRCRFIQRGLIEHKHRRLNDMDTIHERWHVPNHPLYPKVYQELLQASRIEGTQIRLIESTAPSNTGQIKVKRKATGARSQNGRYTKTNQLCKKIVETAKHSQVRMHALCFNACFVSFTTCPPRNSTTSPLVPWLSYLTKVFR